MRYYNSISDATVGMGAKWTHTYSRSISFDPTNLTVVGANREDGKTLSFKLVGSDYVGDPTFSERLAHTSGVWTLTNDDDEIETYDSAGRLASIANRSRLSQTLEYNSSGQLAIVKDPFWSSTDPLNRALTFGYDGYGRITSIGLPGGLTLVYEYTAIVPANQSANLILVRYPDNTTRTYLYEDPNGTFFSGLNRPGFPGEFRV